MNPFRLLSPSATCLLQQAKQSLSKSEVGRNSVSLWLPSFSPLLSLRHILFNIMYTCVHTHACVCIYVLVCMYICVYIIRLVSLPSFIVFLGRLFKAVVTLVPFALYKDFSKSGLCQSYKPSPLWFSFWCWSFLTTCCFCLSNSQAFTSLGFGYFFTILVYFINSVKAANFIALWQ